MLNFNFDKDFKDELKDLPGFKELDELNSINNIFKLRGLDEASTKKEEKLVDAGFIIFQSPSLSCPRCGNNYLSDVANTGIDLFMINYEENRKDERYAKKYKYIKKLIACDPSGSEWYSADNCFKNEQLLYCKCGFLFFP